MTKIKTKAKSKIKARCYAWASSHSTLSIAPLAISTGSKPCQPTQQLESAVQ